MMTTKPVEQLYQCAKNKDDQDHYKAGPGGMALCKPRWGDWTVSCAISNKDLILLEESGDLVKVSYTE